MRPQRAIRTSLGPIALAVIAVAGAASCADILGIGHPKPVESNPGGGGASSSSASAGGGGGQMTSSGTAGSGGGPSCVVVGDVFAALTQDLIGGHTFTPVPVLIPESSPRARTHLAVRDEVTGTLVVLSIHDSGTPQTSQIARSSADVDGPLPIGGYATESKLSVIVLGTVHAVPTIGQVDFTLIDNINDIQMPGVFTPWNTPVECMNHNFGSVAAFATDNGAVYIAGCHDDETNQLGSLWTGGSGAVNPVRVLTGIDVSDPRMFPQLFGTTNDVSYAFFRGTESQDFFYAFGKNPSDLADVKRFSYHQGDVTQIFATLPTKSGDAVTILGGAVPSAGSLATVYSGSTPLADLAKLSMVPPADAKAVGTFNAVSDYGPMAGSYDADSIVIAGQTKDQHSVVFSWFARDSTPLVVDQNVYTNKKTTIAIARAAPITVTDQAVAWVESEGAASQITALVLTCTNGP